MRSHPISPPRFDSCAQHLMWVEFVVGFLPTPRVFLWGFCGCPLQKKQALLNSNSIWTLNVYTQAPASGEGDHSLLF